MKRLLPLWITLAAWAAWVLYLFSPLPTQAVSPRLTYFFIAILGGAAVAAMPRKLMRDAVSNVFVNVVIFFALYVANFSFFLAAAMVIRGK